MIAELLWWCDVHRAAESAEEGTCEVAGLASNVGLTKGFACEFVRAQLIRIPNGGE